MITFLSGHPTSSCPFSLFVSLLLPLALSLLFFWHGCIYYYQRSKQNVKSPNKQVTYLNSVVVTGKRADRVNEEEKSLHNDFVLPAQTGAPHRGEKNYSNGNSSPW